MNGPAGLISVNASIWVHTKNGKRSLTICGWRLSLCSSALIQIFKWCICTVCLAWMNGFCLITLFTCVYLFVRNRKADTHSHFLIRLLPFRFLLSSYFLPVCLCLSVVRLSVETWFCHQLLWAFVFWGLWQPHGQTLWVCMLQFKNVSSCE